MVENLFSGLRLPVIVAPMFLVSGADLVVESCKAGIIGSFPSLNGRSIEDFSSILNDIVTRLAVYKQAHPQAAVAPYAVSLTIRIAGTDRQQQELDVITRNRVPLIITSVGNPGPLVKQIHGYGGKIFHDVTTIRHAEKAAEAGVDGLILVCAGAGGHAGALSPFAFLPQVRKFFDKTIILAGAISDGRSIHAAQALGADLVYMGTRFIATREAKAKDGYKQMLVDQPSHAVICTPAFSGVPANYLTASIFAAGMNPQDLPKPKGLWQPDLPPGVKAWRDIWSAGQGVGMIDNILPVNQLVDQLKAEYDAIG